MLSHKLGVSITPFFGLGNATQGMAERAEEAEEEADFLNTISSVWPWPLHL